MVMPANVTAAANFGGVPLLALESQASRAAPALALASLARATLVIIIIISPTDSQGKKRGRSAKVMPIEAQLNDGISH